MKCATACQVTYIQLLLYVNAKWMHAYLERKGFYGNPVWGSGRHVNQKAEAEESTL